MTQLGEKKALATGETGPSFPPPSGEIQGLRLLCGENDTLTGANAPPTNGPVSDNGAIQVRGDDSFFGLPLSALKDSPKTLFVLRGLVSKCVHPTPSIFLPPAWLTRLCNWCPMQGPWPWEGSSPGNSESAPSAAHARSASATAMSSATRLGVSTRISSSNVVQAHVSGHGIPTQPRIRKERC